MKFVLVLALVAAVSASPSNLLLSQWNNFKAKHNKVYNSIEEESQKLETFAKNLQKIVEHNARFDQGLETYFLGVTQFADMTEAEFLEYLTFSGPVPNLHDTPDIYVAPDDIVIPDHLDYREKNAVNPVRNQKSCGSCWAFSAISTLESNYFLQKGKLLSLSEQNLVDCSLDYGNYGCGGGYMEAAYDYIRDHGIESLKDYPYTATDDKCKFDSKKSVLTISGHTNIEQSSERSLQGALVEIGPIAVAVDASEWSLYQGGIFSTTGSYFLNHGVVAEGVGIENGTEYYIVRNSWGADWGEEGYIRVARNANNQVGISDMACFPNL